MACHASVDAARGDYESARWRLQESLAVHRRRGDQVQVSYVFSQLGWLALAMSDNEQAQRCFAQCLLIDRAVGGSWSIRADLEGLAETAIAQGDLPGADALLAEAATHLPDAGRAGYLPLLQGRLARRRGTMGEARSAYEQAHGHVLSNQMCRAVVTIDYLSELCDFALDVGRLESAARLFATLTELRSTIGMALSPQAHIGHDRATDAIHNAFGASKLDELGASLRARPREELIAAGLAAAASLLTEPATSQSPAQPRTPTLRLLPTIDDHGGRSARDSPADPPAAATGRISGPGKSATESRP
jgi:hypothetical protein